MRHAVAQINILAWVVDSATAALLLAGAARLTLIAEQGARVRLETVVQTVVPVPQPLHRSLPRQLPHPNLPHQLPHPNLSRQPLHQKLHRQQQLLQMFHRMLPVVPAKALPAKDLPLATAARLPVGAAVPLRTVVLVVKRAMVLAPKLGSLLEKKRKKLGEIFASKSVHLCFVMQQ